MTQLSRRAFTAIPIVAAGASLATLPALPVIAEPDPIFAAIETLQAAHQALLVVLEEQADLEESLPSHGTRGLPFDPKPGDNPLWAACMARLREAYEALDDAALELITIKPTTFLGLSALLRSAWFYVAEQGNAWPTHVIEDNPGRYGKGGINFSVALHRHAAEALDALIMKA